MHTITLFSLLAASATSNALKYAVPSNIKVAGCTYPANYTVSDLTISTDEVDSDKNITSFHFADPGTGIDTLCSRNSTSKPSSVSSNRWPCDNQKVSFIYQTTGIAGLTMVEVACPGSTPQFEASGLVTPNLTCTNSTTGSTCVAKQSPILGEFDSLQPTPPSTV
ncbi:hypothetical protein F4804DRAFT_297264 [Jackrogersella minutella]|nr:hypothetical protein F4804DRAFT_297264 [Jackrogersella minutella]